tara:strand:+ start:461 stop:1147 length:687 start_codon:yes stop_codon:yes gene_type:complete
MKEIVVWLIHTPAGTIGLVAATVALSAKKGTALHRKAGTYFTISMLIMLTSGFVAAFLKDSTGDMFLSSVVMYTVFTAWLTVHHKKNETGFLEGVALVWIIAVAIAAFLMSSSSNSSDVATPNLYFFWTGFSLLCAVGDVRNLYLAGLSGIQRLIRHVWRIGFSIIWAALALTDKIVKMRGSNVKEMPEEQVLYIVAVPTMFILTIFLYWIINILFFSRDKYTDNGAK